MILIGWFKKHIHRSGSYRRPFVHPTALLGDRRSRALVKMREGAHLAEYVIVRAHENSIEIGRFTQVGPFCVILVGSPIFIGNHVMIAPHCCIASGNHNYKQINKPMRFAGNLSDGPIVIEDNVWIGANVTITDGVRIGRDAVVGANSVVTRNVEPFDIVAGVPARVIGNRRQLAAKSAAA